MRIESRAAPKERPVLVSAAILRLELRMRLRTPFIFAFCAAVAMLGMAPLAAARDGSTPPSGGEDNSAGDNVIDIPGIGPIPIPLPPGSRVFGPGGAPKQKPAAPSPESRQPQQSPPALRVVGLDDLFARLAAAQDAEEARAIAGAIERFWARSGSDTADLLTTRAGLAENLGEHGLAKDLLDYVLALEPRWAEGFVRRANVMARLGDMDGALADLESAVRLDPKRFDAFAALGSLEEANGRKKPALEAYRRSLAIDPKQDDVFKAEERLRLELEGRDI